MVSSNYNHLFFFDFDFFDFFGVAVPVFWASSGMGESDLPDLLLFFLVLTEDSVSLSDSELELESDE